MIVKRGKPINENLENLHVIVSIDGFDYPFNHAAPAGLSDAELQQFAEARESQYRFYILRDLYPDCPKEYKTDLETMEKWILDGCIIPAVLNEEGNEIAPERVVGKKEWTSTHPVVKNKIIDVIEIDQSAVDLYQQVKADAASAGDQVALDILALLKKVFWG